MASRLVHPLRGAGFQRSRAHRDGVTTRVHHGVALHHHQVYAARYRRWCVHGGYLSKGHQHPATPRVHRR